MKKVKAILSAAVVLAMLFILAVASFANIGEAEKGTPEIDGVIDEIWDKAKAYDVALLKDGESNGVTSYFKTMWDDNYFYLLVVAVDPDICYDAVNVWEKDGVEMFVDWTGDMPETYGETYGGDYAMGLREDPETEFPTFSENNAAVEEYKQEIIDDILYVTAITETGYILEARVNPLLNYSDFELAVGTQLGFDIQVNDLVTGNTNRYGAYGWADEENVAWQMPSALGILTLKDSPYEAPAEEEEVEEVAEPVLEEVVEEVEEEVEEEEEAPAPVTTTNPSTADISVIMYALVALSAVGGIAVFKKK